MQLHAADPDDFAPPERVAALCRAAQQSSADLEVFRYPGANHSYTDHDLPDHDRPQQSGCWDLLG
ncbi:hypothetical protein GCM10010377_70360 [Streptomyces viridiviolaceus]|uniref:Dienelactone hydrolase family protein n=1 Tax=Streptomyces viridiviolaceus TaxID=68282 RepID=A0ABW2E9Q3_9ACTN|nr:dienelactone hydrolase family protein [Streptomyces viridiviolaceus]GHB69590.1 hypothetical protein GCM10010377_70360 [Streptomyces viridiviolaceus]